MTDEVVEHQYSGEDTPAITIQLGSGHVRCQVIKLQDQFGIVFDSNAGSGAVGEKADAFVGDTIKPGQVVILCGNEHGAIALCQLAMTVVQLYRDGEPTIEDTEGRGEGNATA